MSNETNKYNVHNTWKYCELQINAYGYYLEAVWLTICYYMQQEAVKHASQQLQKLNDKKLAFECATRYNAKDTMSYSLRSMNIQREIHNATIHKCNVTNASHSLLLQLMDANSNYSNAMEDILILVDVTHTK